MTSLPYRKPGINPSSTKTGRFGGQNTLPNGATWGRPQDRFPALNCQEPMVHGPSPGMGQQSSIALFTRLGRSIAIPRRCARNPWSSPTFVLSGDPRRTPQNGHPWPSSSNRTRQVRFDEDSAEARSRTPGVSAPRRQGIAIRPANLLRWPNGKFLGMSSGTSFGAGFGGRSLPGVFSPFCLDPADSQPIQSKRGLGVEGDSLGCLAPLAGRSLRPTF